MWHLGADVHHAWHLFETVHIFRERFPVERHSFRQDGTGNILDTFHKINQVVGLVCPYRRKPYTAVTKNSSRDAVPGRWCEVRVPGGLPVIVRVDINKSWGHQKSPGVNFPCCGPFTITDVDNETVLDGNVRPSCGCTRAINDHAAPDQ